MSELVSFLNGLRSPGVVLILASGVVILDSQESCPTYLPSGFGFLACDRTAEANGWMKFWEVMVDVHLTVNLNMIRPLLPYFLDEKNLSGSI
ncbi:hypothetical protein BDZ94DRAFT_1313421 [Collybia nuda]|uniref:Uncharacterized protein n=1 Tax=Collybia nuda TaxID=64659 RepID=A0A9P5XWF5_9AGAR|nr:hypothetical protein BDZ94DRAFT_1313421 [Collybia nuda]